MTIAAYALIVHAIYVAAFVPHLVTKVAGWDTVVSRQLLFSGVENQPR
jgi:hypothetical protein